MRKNPTDEEKKIWYGYLRHLKPNFHRQRIIGNYIVDFYIAEKKIVIEIDGIQHGSYEHQQKDKVRDSKLSKWEITVLRYSNESIRREFNWVAGDILAHLGLSFADLKTKE